MVAWISTVIYTIQDRYYELFPTTIFIICCHGNAFSDNVFEL